MPNTRQLQFLARVRKAFVNARDETAVQDLMGPLGYDKAEIEEGLALVDAAEREAREADTERAESRAATRTAGQARAKVATAERDTAVEAATGYWEDFYDVAVVALEDESQLRETMGMREAGS